MVREERMQPNGVVAESQWPPELEQGKGVLLGLFVGGCVERGIGSRFRRQAHAHTQGLWKDWICILSAKRLTDRQLLLHELAHIFTGEGHTNTWRRCLLAFGGTLDGSRDKGDCHLRYKHYRDPRRPHLGRAHHPDCPCHAF